MTTNGKQLRSFLAWVDSAAARRHELLTEKLSARHRIPPYELLFIEALEGFQTVQAV